MLRSTEVAMPGAARRKLGLSLAGGGFRASLFHLGVLHRLAELDLLRRVEVLSTVSGGSIVGALYILLLKRDRLMGVEAPHEPRQLSRAEYVALVQELDRRLTKAIKLNLRNALFWNPFATLRVLLTRYTLGERMSNVYERYLYRDVVDQLLAGGMIKDERRSWMRWIWPGRIRLEDIRAQHLDRSLPGGIEAYNRQQSEKPDGCAITDLVLNATSVNSGARFWFSSSELGDWYLGHFRHSEIPRLKQYHELQASLPRGPGALGDCGRGPDPVMLGKVPCERRVVILALLLRDHRKAQPEDLALTGAWHALFAATGYPTALLGADLGQLRQLKQSAWYMRIGSDTDRFQPPVLGGFSFEEHRVHLFSHIEKMDPALAQDLQAFAPTPGDELNLVLDFILELYWLRSADVVSPDIDGDWERLTLGQAVGASACFPPVFTPINWFGFYDDAHVARLGLTDGGVFDNMGIFALMDEGCTHIIASDTSGVFTEQSSATSSRLGLPGRLASILTKDLASMQRDILRERRHVSRALDEISEGQTRLASQTSEPATMALRQLTSELDKFASTRRLRGLAYFEIDSAPIPGFTQRGQTIDLAALAMTRTDLDGFGDAEIAMLVDAGYSNADAYVRKYLPDFMPEGADPLWNAPPSLPHPLPTENVGKILKAARSRFYRSLRIPGAWRVIPLLTALASGVAVLLGLWGIRSTFSDALSWRPGSLARYTVWDGWLDLPLGPVLIGVAGMVGLVLAVRHVAERNRFSRRWTRWVGKWARSVSGSLLFFFGWKPVAAIVGALFVYAWVNWLLFHQPFLRLTAVKGR